MYEQTRLMCIKIHLISEWTMLSNVYGQTRLIGILITSSFTYFCVFTIMNK